MNSTTATAPKTQTGRLFAQLRKAFDEPAASALLVLVLAGDLVYIILHMALGATGNLSAHVLFALHKDQGYPEFYQYAKEFWVVILLILVAARTRVSGYLSWAALFCFLLIDDSLGIHEAGGAMIANSLDLAAQVGMRAEDIGELAVAAIAGCVLLGAVGICWRRGEAAFRRASRHLFILLIVVCFFGIFIDSLHFLYEMNWKVRLVSVVIEDGCEMLAMSLIFWYAFLLYLRNGDVGVSLRDLYTASR